jgi:hypothetical protein
MPERTFTYAIIGYDNISSFVKSTFHPDSLLLTILSSVTIASISSFFKDYVGINAPIALAIFLLFCMEMFTGVYASKKEGRSFESSKFGRGFIKMGLYIILIGVSHALAKNMIVPPGAWLTFNIYEWVYYVFLNFTILQLIVSNIENFNRLGWDEMMPVLKRLSSILKLGKGGKEDFKDNDSEEKDLKDE